MMAMIKCEDCGGEYNEYRLDEHCCECEQLRAENAALQAKIDRLMLEYCPEEMTAEQMANWAKHQRPVTVQLEAIIDAAMKEEE